MKHIKKMKIDIDKNNFEVIPSVQYDSNTRFLHINLLNGSVPFNLTGCSVKISGTKQDGTAIFNNCTIISEKEGFVEVELTEQMNAVSGTLECELKIYSANGVLTTKRFSIDITSSVTSKEITSGNEFKALTDALKVVQGIDNKADKEKVEEKFGEVYEQLDNKADEKDLIIKTSTLQTDVVKLKEYISSGIAQQEHSHINKSILDNLIEVDKSIYCLDDKILTNNDFSERTHILTKSGLGTIKQGVVNPIDGSVVTSTTNWYVDYKITEGNYSKLDYQTFPTSTGLSGIAFLNTKGDYIIGYRNSTFERKIINIPENASIIRYSYVTDDYAEVNSVPKFNYLKLYLSDLNLPERIILLNTLNEENSRLKQDKKTICFIEDFVGGLPVTKSDLGAIKQGVVNSTTGAIGSTSTTNWYADYEITEGKYSKLQCQLYKTSSTAGIAFLDKNGTYISGSSSSIFERKTIDIPSNAKIIRYCYITDEYAETNGYPKFDYLKLYTNEEFNNKEFVNLRTLGNFSSKEDRTYFKENKIAYSSDLSNLKLTKTDLGTIKQGVVNSNNGVVNSSNTTNWYVDYEITEGKYSKIYCPVYATSGTAGIAFLNKNGTYIKGYSRQGAFERKTIDIPSNAKIIRYCYITDEYAEINGYPKFTNIKLFLNPNYNGFTDENNLVLISKKDYDVVSDYKNELMSHGSILSFDEKGYGYNVYLANPTDVGEHPWDTNIVPKLSKFNLCNPTEREIVTVAKANTSIGTIDIGARAPYEPNLIIKDDIIYCYLSLLIDGVLGYYKRDINKNDLTLADNVEALKLIYNSEEIDFSMNNVISIYNSLTNKNITLTDFMLTSRIVKNNNTYYGFITGWGDGFGGIIISSLDGVKWEVLKACNFGDIEISEAQLIIEDDIMFIVARNNATGIHKAIYNITTSTFTYIGKIDYSVNARPQIFKFNGDKYIFYNIREELHNGAGTVIRNLAQLSKIDSSMNETFVKTFRNVDGFHYYSVCEYKNRLYMTFSTDLRRLNLGNACSNIGFMELDVSAN